VFILTIKIWRLPHCVLWALIVCFAACKAQPLPAKLYLSPALVDTTLQPNHFIDFSFSDCKNELTTKNKLQQLTVYATDGQGEELKAKNKQLYKKVTIEYTATGKIAKIEKAADDKVELIYNDSGWLIQSTRYNKNAFSEYKKTLTNYTYDLAGNLATTYAYHIGFDNVYKFETYTKYDYILQDKLLIVYSCGIGTDGLGQFIFEKEYHFVKNQLVLMTGNSNSFLRNDKSRWFTETYTYNVMGNLISKCSNYGIGMACKIYEWDAANRLIRKADSLYDDKTASKTIASLTYEYQKNVVTEKYIVDTKLDHSKYGPNGIQSTHIYKYDTSGLLISQQEIKQDVQHAKTFTYQFDTSVNWVWRIHKEKYTTENNTSQSIEPIYTYRKFTYHSNVTNTMAAPFAVDAKAEALKQSIIDKNKFVEKLHYTK
jgi:hypothetical protein